MNRLVRYVAVALLLTVGSSSPCFADEPGSETGLINFDAAPMLPGQPLYSVYRSAVDPHLYLAVPRSIEIAPTPSGQIMLSVHHQGAKAGAVLTVTLRPIPVDHERLRVGLLTVDPEAKIAYPTPSKGQLELVINPVYLDEPVPTIEAATFDSTMTFSVRLSALGARAFLSRDVAMGLFGAKYRFVLRGRETGTNEIAERIQNVSRLWGGLCGQYPNSFVDSADLSVGCID